MTDRRETACNGRVAHVSLEGTVAADRFTQGAARSVTAPVTPLCAEPKGARDRELLLGDGFQVLETQDGWSYGIAARDGYVGYVRDGDLGPAVRASHVVSAARSYAKPSADLKATEPTIPISFGSRVVVAARDGDWAQIMVCGAAGWMPAMHLRDASDPAGDPVAVAERFIGTPYLWGGNSAFGIDCSGLVQAAMLACGVPCSGDSDQQERSLGDPVPLDAPRQRGDLYFWKGHVGLLYDADTLLHANGHAMAVSLEPLEQAIARIEKSEGPVTSRRRVSPPRG